MIEERDWEMLVGKLKDMKGWVRFLGIMNIISGVVTALTIVGILVAWIPIWIGIILLRAAGKIDEISYSPEPLPVMLGYIDDLKTYFLLRGVLVIVGFIFWIVVVIMALNEGNNYPSMPF